MSSHSPKDKIKITLAISLILSLATSVFAQEQPAVKEANRGYVASSDTGEMRKGTAIIAGSQAGPAESQEEGKLTELQKQARFYRAQGLRLQNMGNLAAALSFYQKAIELDPAYAVAYNDLGVVYESAQAAERAEDSYLKAVKVDPNYLSSYTNLALFYEGKRDLDKAAFYWKKRADLGKSDDPWTQRARNRLDDLAQVAPNYRQMVIESETISLMKKVAEEKLARQRQELAESAKYYAGAKSLYLAGNYQKAREDIDKSLVPTPSQKDKLALKVKIQNALEEQARKAGIKQRSQNSRKMREYFEDGIRDYQQGNREAAALEFNRIIELTESPQEN